jgi:hypothetical protein
MFSGPTLSSRPVLFFCFQQSSHAEILAVKFFSVFCRLVYDAANISDYVTAVVRIIGE